MNNPFTILPANLLRQSLGEAEDILSQLLTAAQALADADENHTRAKSAANAVAETLAAAEVELIVAAETQAQAGDGPLAGLAKTSKAYTAALAKLINDAHAGELAELHANVRGLSVVAEEATIAADRARTLYSSYRHASDLKAAILKASL
ncbi:MAG: hypothetical protein KJZ86_12470 [Caldilineaceae bacterium]|nr:hypothetical protein [Caldilineaceae bacterium]